MADDKKCRGCGEVIGHGRGLRYAVYCQACTTKSIHAGFTRAELFEAFERIKPADNWKNPIEAFLNGPLSDHEIQAIDAAIGFYCGGGARFQVLGTKLRVWAPGYYALIGA